MSSLIYFFKQAIKGFRRNFGTTFGSIVTIFLSMFIIGLFVMGGQLVNNAVSQVENEVSVSVYLRDDANSGDVDKLKEYINSLSSVKSVSYKTKEEALESFSKSSTNQQSVEQLDGYNPLPNSLEVELNNPQDVQSVVDDISNNDYFKKVCDSPNNMERSISYGQKTVDKLFDFTQFIRIGCVVLIALLIFIAMVFINNTIRLAIMSRSREISIMRLVGASNGFIRGPFLMEGALNAFIGSLLAVLVLEIVRNLVFPAMQSALSFLDMNIPFGTVLLTYLGIILVSIIIGLLASRIAMRRYLKV